MSVVLRHLRSHPVRWALLLVTLAVAAFYLAPKASDAISGVRGLSGGDLGWILLSLGGEVASLLCFSLVTWNLVDRGERPPFRRVFRLDLVTVALSHAVPVGSAAGSALGYELLEEEGVEPLQAGFVKLSQSLVSGLLLEVMLAFTAFLTIALDGVSDTTVSLTVLGFVLLVVVGGFTALLVHPGRLVKRWAVRLLGWIPRLDRGAIASGVDQLSDRMQQLLRSPGQLANVSVWSLGNWVFDLISLWAALKAFGAPPSPVLVTVAFCVAQVASAIPISPAGLGVVESALTPLLVSFGASGTAAVLGVLTWRVMNYWLPLPVGGTAYLAIVAERRRGWRGRPPQRRGRHPAASSESARSAPA